MVEGWREGSPRASGLLLLGRRHGSMGAEAAPAAAAEAVVKVGVGGGRMVMVVAVVVKGARWQQRALSPAAAVGIQARNGITAHAHTHGVHQEAASTADGVPGLLQRRQALGTTDHGSASPAALTATAPVGLGKRGAAGASSHALLLMLLLLLLWMLLGLVAKVLLTASVHERGMTIAVAAAAAAIATAAAAAHAARASTQTSVPQAHASVRLVQQREQPGGQIRVHHHELRRMRLILQQLLLRMMRG